MALNEMIAQGAQFKMPDPLEQYGRIAQIQQAQNQNALAQYQINSAKRADETNTNFLSSLRAAGDDPVKQRQALMMAGRVKEAGELDASALTRQETQGRIQEQQRKSFSSDLLDLGSNPTDEKIIFLAKNIAADPNYSLASKAVAEKKFAELIAMPFDKRKESLLTSGMTGEQRSTAALAQQKLVAPDPMQITRADGKIIFVDKNPYSPTFKQEILPPQAAGMTPFQTGSLDVSRKNLGVSQGNQRLAQEKFNWEKANPGKTIKEVEQVDEKLDMKKASMGTVVKDFQKSDAPQFMGKSQKKRQAMADAAKLTAERGKLPMNKEERLLAKLADISETHKRTMVSVFEKLNEDNQYAFMQACDTADGIEQMLDFSISYRGE